MHSPGWSLAWLLIFHETLPKVGGKVALHCLTSSTRGGGGGSVNWPLRGWYFPKQRPTRRVAKTVVPGCPLFFAALAALSALAAQAKTQIAPPTRPRDRGLAQSRASPHRAGSSETRCPMSCHSRLPCVIGPSTGILCCILRSAYSTMYSTSTFVLPR